MKKVLCVLFKIFLFLSIIIFSEFCTYSFFITSYKNTISIRAAETFQILKSIKIEKTNPKYIEIEGSDELAFDPTIYFLIEGEASKYIDHINPVRITKGQKINLPIVIDMSLPEAVNLIKNRNGKDSEFINGTVWVKYLNDYINLPFEFKFSDQYLLNEFMSSLNYNKKYEDDDKEMVMPYITDIIIYTAGYGKWDKIMISGVKDEQNAEENFIPKLEMTKYQKTILDVVAPELYTIIESNLLEKESSVKVDEIKQENINHKQQN